MGAKNHRKEFDIIIVGAGPAGAECARELSKLGRKVLILERSQRIGEPNFSSGGTPKQTLKDFELPLRVAKGSWSKILFKTQGSPCLWDYKSPMGYVLDFKELKKFLVREALNNGAQLLVGTSAQEPILENGAVAGVKYSGIFGEGVVRGKIVVDASGPVGVLASKLKLREAVPCPPSVGIETIIENKSITQSLKPFSHTLSFYLGDYYAPHGYGWIFPFGKDSFKVGVGVYRAADYGIKKSDYSDLMEIFKKFLDKFSQFKNIQIEELHGGTLYITGGIKKYSRNGFLVIGDAACQINPLLGEGIRHALYSGKMAANVINKALSKNDFSEEALSEYDQKWKKYIGLKWQLVLKIAERVYGGLTPKQWEGMMRYFAQLSPKESIEVLFNYKAPKIFRFKRLPKSIKVLKTLLTSKS
jgi:geranylgeranyl reductase family protein